MTLPAIADRTALERPMVERAADAAVRAIPPAWPLDSTVAVNPFLGQTGERLAAAGARLARVGGVPVAMARAWYLARIERGEIGEEALAAALAASPHAGKPADVAALRAAAADPRPAPAALPTVADLAAGASGVDWPGLLADRIGAWAGAEFDRGQALWQVPQGRRAWDSWRAWARRDLTPEIHGLQGFAALAAAAPDRPADAILAAVRALGLSPAALETYFHQLLLSLGGWAQYGRQRLWEAELHGGADTTAADLLAIRLLWEQALHGLHGAAIAEPWERARAAHAAPIEPGPAEIVDEILQEAAERAAQARLARTLAAPAEDPGAAEARPALQAAFCIDVRSEVFRRALESVDPGIRTLGFAGFFGVSAEHRGFASDIAERRLPVLLQPGVCSVADGAPEADRAARHSARAGRAWGRFKLAAVSSFAFVEAAGPIYVGKLLRDALGLAAPEAPAEPAPRLDPALPLSARIDAAETVLHAMALTEGFARVVLLAGHGAGVVNDPHRSALQCGACGGYSGEVNARLLAALLNEAEVRAGLSGRGIEIPEDTLFLAGLHDTTTDAVTLYDADADTAGRAEEILRIRGWLAEAGRLTRGERAPRLSRAGDGSAIPARARDWAEVRPEWGLAGCAAFVAAPRARTRGRKLEGRAFLHDYDWQADNARGYPVLELILTAPVVVASWISLQYYGSTVAPETFGAGNKLLHNVVGGIGVLEGNGGAMRAGLAWQSVQDGQGEAHEPLRLAVYVEAPTEAIGSILARHPDVRALFDNRWLHLFALGADGRVAARYAGDLAWES